ncbi:DUF2267 domain-containing protein [Streptomyces sp. 549]|uniref:DUF2267 domain-containing protein n=1 Tax=Streptomyces sp. 549 TaxID=3049076 RepID=UPI0024C37C8A|nr:DUF2267 domain-containing protein [Streptomyces sp. 549]MDK1472395.1 DUF2267 domain-containing protein [Streptomyces sp. 549]
MVWSELVDGVRRHGRYGSAAEAEQVTRTVLGALGAALTAEQRTGLAAGLPPEAAVMLTAGPAAGRPLKAAEFVAEIASRVAGATPATARWDAGSVLGVLPAALADDAADDELTDLLAALPTGYALLFGRAELVRAA